MRSTVKIIADAADPMAAASALIRINMLWDWWAPSSSFWPLRFLATWLGQPEIVGALRIGALEVLLMPVARAHRDALLGVSNYGNAGMAGGVFHIARLAAVIGL